MKKLTKEEKLSRIIARGEMSGHGHIITGDAKVTHNSKGEILVEVGREGAVLKHLMEASWLEGQEKWTGEHTDIDLSEMPAQVRHGDVMLDKVGERTYKFIQQQEYNPLNGLIQQVRD